MRSEPVLITGASGLLGANLVLNWLQLGWPATALYCKHPVSFGVPSFGVDLCDAKRIRDLVEHQRPAWIVHSAAATSVDWCEDHPAECYRVNVDASRNLAAAAKAVGARFAYISTDAVFDGSKGSYKESDLVCPLNVYARSKVLAEQAVTELLPESLIIRTNIYGWNLQDKLSLAEWMLKNFETKTQFQGFDDVVFSPILVNDLASLLAQMLIQDLKGVFHVAGSESCSKFAFAEQLAEVFGHDRRFVERAYLDDARLRASRPRNTSLQIGKARLALDCSIPGIRDGLERFKRLHETGYTAGLKRAAIQGGLV